MKFLLISFLIFYPATSAEWLLDFDKAKLRAQTEHKYILLNFSGSDWCGPCIQMNKEIFETATFDEFAKEHLVLVNADFPRLKKHALSDSQLKKNEQLAESYNKKGIFPLTLLLNFEGKVIKSWEGFPLLSAGEFTREIQNELHGEKR